MKLIDIKVKRNIFFLLKRCEEDLNRELMYDDEEIDNVHYKVFIKWHNENYNTTLKFNSRAFSTAHRIEIAYKTKWRCVYCRQLLKPTFQIDHVKELHEGGKDVYSNLVATCVECHAKKTRTNILKRSRIFKNEYRKRSARFEQIAFEDFRYKKKSKYFTNKNL